MFKFILNNIGLILNLVGTIMVAISFGHYPDKKEAPYTGNSEHKKYIAYFNNPKLFYFGLFVLSIGFVLQLKI